MEVGGWMLKEDFENHVLLLRDVVSGNSPSKSGGLTIPCGFLAKQDGVCCHEVARFSQVVSSQL
jgi:hypothetical protein